MAGLMYAASDSIHYANNHSEVKHLHFYADNTSALQSILEPKIDAGQSFAWRFRQLIFEFLDQDDNRTVDIAWSPGHKDIMGNERADTLAKAGAERWSRDHQTITHSRRKAKEKVLADWTRKWKQTPPTGGFAAANRIPPTLKPDDIFTTTPREIFGRLIQCRTGHGFFGEYYAKFVPSESTQCPCGTSTQSRHHILTECARYAEHRPILEKAAPGLFLPDLLGTKPGIAATANFIKKSGAFTKTGEHKVNHSHEEPDYLDNESETPDPIDMLNLMNGINFDVPDVDNSDSEDE